jgi:hypothetical protein
VVGVTGAALASIPAPGGGINSVTYLAGEQINVIFPRNQSTPITVTASAYLSNELTNETNLFTRSSLKFKALDFFITHDEFVLFSGTSPVTANICVSWKWWYPWSCKKRENRTIIPGLPPITIPGTEIDLGPVWDSGSVAVTESDRNVLSNATFSLGGFEPYSLGSFSLNPETPPVVDIGGPYTVDEGDLSYTLDGTGSKDPDEGEVGQSGDLGYLWTDEGHFVDNEIAEPVFISTEDDAVITVTLAVNDLWNTDDTSIDVTVVNVNPDIFAQSPETIDEGELFERTITFSDPGLLDTHTATIYWDDTTESIVEIGTAGATHALNRSFDISHVYADDDEYTVSVVVVDDDGGSNSKSFVITANNVKPTVNTISDVTATEGEPVEIINSGFSDPGTLDTHTATIDWGDGTDEDNGSVSEANSGPPGSDSGMLGSVSGDHVYADNGTYTVTLSVDDHDGGVTSTSFDVDVENVKPVLTASDGYEGDEGREININIAFNDLGTADTHTATILWGDTTSTPTATVNESPFGPPSSAGSVDGANGSVTGSHVYADNGLYTVTVEIEDDDGSTDSTQFTITMLNVAPTVDAGDDREWLLHDLTQLDPSEFNDPGTLDTHTSTTDWVDGPLTNGVVTETAYGHPGSTDGVDGTVADSHIYRYPGDYAVVVTVTDDGLDYEGGTIGESDGETADTVVLTILGAIDLKQRAIGFLTPFISEDRNISTVIGNIQGSLEQKLWQDLAYLDPHLGNRVFIQERQAVANLESALSSRRGLSVPAIAAVNEAIDHLVTADRILAESQIYIAGESTVWTPKAQSNYERQLQRAEDQFATAWAEVDAGNLVRAIDHFRLAWLFASLAEQQATGQRGRVNEG